MNVSSEYRLSSAVGPLRIFRAGPEQVGIVQALARQTFVETFSAFNTAENLQSYLDAAFSEEALAAALVEPSNGFFLVETQDQTLIGYLHIQQALDASDSTLPASVVEGNAAMLQRFYLLAPWHGSGIARLLMDFCLERVAEAGKGLLVLGVWEKNERALAFYQKCGFSIVGSHPFKLGDDAQTDYWMSRPV